MQTTIIPAASILIPSDRQRQEYPKAHIAALRDSIAEDCLLHAVAVTDGLELISGFCRREAVLLLNAPYKYGDFPVEAGMIPVVVVRSRDDYALQRLELEENLRRKNLSPAEEARAIAKLHKMRTKEAEEQGIQWNRSATVQVLDQLRGEESTPSAGITEVSEALLIDQFMDDPDIQRAKSRREAVKIAKKKLENELGAALGALITIKSEEFELLEGPCQLILPGLTPGRFAGIVTDPPYGISADQFGDQAFTSGHQYSDDLDSANAIAKEILDHGYRICKDDAHLYMFCDIRNWPELFSLAAAAGWAVYPTPLIWSKPNAGHAPQPGYFTRRYEALLFARKGGRKLARSAPDVFTFNSVGDKVHAAQKPVELYEHLMKLSFLPGETVLDPCAGSGTIFEAAKKCSLAAVGIEQDEGSIALCKSRIIKL